ncbi:hypothetical protein ADUPG1_007835 [Aduncisulcus paluster]|uniref:Protein kinase domain-containing protein n=1 Tax=Aduncisulcus paluster TaxID=2918883 RepID=A0ABQ5KPQ2_9EUKA|nr:hypothetical protein ADUPG1_007835 [Aduncisulcus paluster]
MGKSGHKRKKDDMTLISASDLKSLCYIGEGGFGSIYIVKIKGVSQLCVLKKLLKVGDKKVIKACRSEFKMQVKLFMNARCFNRIPRPIFILDLLDEDYKGVYGFCMEFCIGGSVKEFAKSWCVSSSSDSDSFSDYDSSSEDSSSDSDSDSYSNSDSSSTRIDPMTLDPLRVEEEDSEDSSSDSSSDSSTKRIDPMTLDPLRVSALCVGMIECLSEVIKAKPDLIHRDIKPDNFLVRVDPKDEECTIVLADLGLVQIQDSISSSTTSKSFIASSRPKDVKSKPEHSVCGTLVYNSCEALEGMQSQKSDAYSLGLTLFAVFESQDPFVQIPMLKGISNPIDFVTELKNIIMKGMGPKLHNSRLFRTLKTIEGGKFKPVYSCLNDVFQGLTKLDMDERMSVYEACEKVQSIKHLLPKIGEGWKCPSSDDIVKVQLAKHKGDSGCIVEKDSSIQTVVLKPNWDDSLSHPSESKMPSSSASKKERKEKDLRKEVDRQVKEIEVLKLKLKHKKENRRMEGEKMKKEELKTAKLRRKVDHRVIFDQTSKSYDLVGIIKKCPDPKSTSRLYHKHRKNILSVFLTFQSKRKIEEHKREIVLCVQCLMWFVCHVISGNGIYLPIPDLNDLIDTFIAHLSRCEEVLEGDVDEEYCVICWGYTFKVQGKWDSFLPKISPTFKRILERGSKKKLGHHIVRYLLITLRNISISPSSSTRSSILTLIKPYIRDCLRIYNDSKCYGKWMYVLSYITLSSDNSTSDKSICSEAWLLFHPVLDVVKREFVGDKFVEDDHERVLRFFSNLCCDPRHAIEIYTNVKDLLDGWFRVIKRKEHERGIICWCYLIFMFSTVPSLVPHISPTYDAKMKWCNINGGWMLSHNRYHFTRYLRNCKKSSYPYCNNHATRHYTYHYYYDPLR